LKGLLGPEAGTGQQRAQIRGSFTMMMMMMMTTMAKYIYCYKQLV
jgi:hypothetical protein